jgi:glycosyltransferase involved in cell wall biosynthesis
MKIVILSSLGSIHTIRWANGLAERGHELHILSCHSGGDPLSEKVIVHELPHKPPQGYFLNKFALRKILASIKPDILNAHYASGYGTLARLSGFHPCVLSVWGSDVYDFPEKSLLHRMLLKKNLLFADVVCSTSHVMAKQTRMICPELQEIPVTPFGVDTELFKPMPELRDERYITIGTVKTLAPKYGIDLLLRAFAHVREVLAKENSETAKRLRLMIVGSGPQEKELMQLAENLGISDQCQWVPRVPHTDVPKYLNKLDIYVALSRQESFGVAVIEASACGIPVVVSDVGGFPEVVKDGETGVIVEKEKPQEAGNVILELVKDQDFRLHLGKNGIRHIALNYEWISCVKTMEKILKRSQTCPKQVFVEI